MAAPMAGTGRLAARRKARLLPTGRVAHGLAQRSRAVHPLPPPRLETEQRSSPPPLPPPCAVRPTRRHSAPRHCSTWGPTAASAAAAAAGPTAAAPFQIRLGRDPRRRVATCNCDPRRPGPTLTAPTGCVLCCLLLPAHPLLEELLELIHLHADVGTRRRRRCHLRHRRRADQRLHRM